MPRGVNWIAIRTAYVVNGWTAQKCATEFGLNITTVSIRASKEGWTDERTRNTTNTSIATTEAMLAVVAHVSATHVEAAENILRLTRIAAGKFEEYMANATPKEMRGVVETGRALSEWTERAMTASRLAQGMRPGDKSAPDIIEATNQVLPARIVIGRPIDDELKQLESA